MITEILVAEDLLTMKDCQENLGELEMNMSTLALLCTCGGLLVDLAVPSQAMWLPCWGQMVKLCSPSSRSKGNEDFWGGQQS